MVRVLASLLSVLALSACAVGSPSVLSSLSSQDNDISPRSASYGTPSPRATYGYADPAPGRSQQPEPGIGSTISGWWDSVKSGFGSEEQAKPGKGQAQAFDPASAQKLVNAYRAQKGLKPLKLNTKLSDAARRHSEDLAKSDRISHYGSDGSDAWERVRKTGYGAKMAAENVGTGQQSVEEVFRGWQNSKDHNANLLLKDADEMGVAMVYNPKSQFKTFWTMVVASPKSVN